MSPSAHTWKHANSVVARIAITWFKHDLAKRTGDWEKHFDRDALRAAAGMDVVGWVEAKLDTVDLPAWAEEMAMDFLEVQ